MEYTIVNIEAKKPVINGKEIVGYQEGYAFIDKNGYCIMIVYGKNNRDNLIKYLESWIIIQ